MTVQPRTRIALACVAVWLVTMLTLGTMVTSDGGKLAVAFWQLLVSNAGLAASVSGRMHGEDTAQIAGGLNMIMVVFSVFMLVAML